MSNPDTPTLEEASQLAEWIATNAESVAECLVGTPDENNAQRYRRNAELMRWLAAAAARAQALEQETCETCRFASDPWPATRYNRPERACYRLHRVVPIEIDSRPFACRGWQAKDASRAHAEQEPSAR